MISVTVVIPTLRRPEPLRRALTSVLRQVSEEAVALDVVVVDNAPEGGAEAVVAATAAAERRAGTGSAVPVRCVAEPSPGVATARNRGVAEARGEWVAFLDDDEQALPGWIAGLLRTAHATGADAVFGPVMPRAEGAAPDGPDGMGPFARDFGRAFALPQGADLTGRSAYLGTNNSMFHRTRCLDPAVTGAPTGGGPFDERLNQCGGEDSLLLRRLRDRGRRFVWAPAAAVTEWVPPRRLTWAYVLRRRFLSGQIRTFVHRMLEPPAWGGVALWMAVGAAQVAVAGPLALALRPFDGARAQRWLALAYGGLGKVLWMERFRPGLYGQGLVS